MKKVIIFFASAIFSTISFGQMEKIVHTEDQATARKIDGQIKMKDYFSAIQELNMLIPKYSDQGFLYFYRGVARLGINDHDGAMEDFILAQSSNYWFNNEAINFLTSKKSMAKRLMDYMKYDQDLDSSRNFKPVIRPEDTLQGAMRPERSCYDVYFYDLTIKILPDTKSIEGSNRISFTAISRSKRIQIDLFPELKISSITMDGRELKFERLYRAVFVDLGEELQPGGKYSITVNYGGEPRIAPKPPWNGGFVWEKTKGRYNVGVACEQLGASSWWPVKDHLSDKPDSMKINLQVPSDYIGVSNGNLRSKKETGDGYTTFEWFVSYPINSYNVTVYMGDFMNYADTIRGNGRSFPVDYYILTRNLEKAKKYYAQTHEIFEVYEKLFGEYPFKRDGAGMVDAPFEGMEHQGAIAIGGNYGKGSKREVWPKGYDYLLIHETAHEWWGNAVAIGDMADAWINEGFTTYAECLFAERKSGYQDYLNTIASKFREILNAWPVVGERNINDNTFLTGDIYNKGAAMLNNLRCIINDDSLFMKIIRDYYRKYLFKITTTQDFIDLVKQEYPSQDLSEFFRIFLYQEKPPILKCQYVIDRKHTLTFTYRWTNVGPNFEMPFCIAVNGKDYVRLSGTPMFQTYTAEKVKSFSLANENNFDEKLVPRNSFTYYWTSWNF